MNIRSVGRCGPSHNSSIGFRHRVSSLRDCQTDVEQVRRCYIFNFREPKRVKKNQEVTKEFTSYLAVIRGYKWRLVGSSGRARRGISGEGGADCMLPGSYSSTSLVKSKASGEYICREKGLSSNAFRVFIDWI